MNSWSSAEPFAAGFFARLYATVLATGAVTDLDAWVWPTIAVLAVLILALVALLSVRRSPAQSAGLAMLLLGLALPAVMVYALTAPAARAFYVPRLAPRYFLPLASTFYILVGWGLAQLWRDPARWRRIAGIAGAGIATAVAVAGLASLFTGRGQTDQYLSLAATLDAHRRPGDIVLLYSDHDWPVFAAEYAGSWRNVPAGMDVNPGSVDALLSPIWQEAEGVWLVTNPNGQQIDPERLVPRWLGERAAGEFDWLYGETALTLYAANRERALAGRALASDMTTPAEGRAVAGGTLLSAWLPMSRYLVGDSLHVALTWEQPPTTRPQLILDGPVRRALPLQDWPAASVGPTRQQVDWPLLADLSPGRYRLSLADNQQEVAIAEFDLITPRRTGEATVDDITYPLDLRLGDSIRLLGYDLPQTVIRRDEPLPLTLYWETTSPLGSRYKVFTHLVGEVYNAGRDNFLWGAQDNEPVGDQLPTTQWVLGQQIKDAYRIRLDPALPPGKYRLEIGMYGLIDGARLPVIDGGGNSLGDAVVIGEIEVR
jgi:hypothetical protein